MWDVLLVFLIPFGGGIPAGVILAGQKGMPWLETGAIYCLSDIILAFAFEAIILLLLRGKLGDAFRQATKMITSRWGANPGPFALVVISFGVDPMTGRTAALMMGHGFIMGWAIAITGDMIYFTVLMASTLWLNNILGDGTWAAAIVMIAMFGVPWLVNRLKSKPPEPPPTA